MCLCPLGHPVDPFLSYRVLGMFLLLTRFYVTGSVKLEWLSLKMSGTLSQRMWIFFLSFAYWFNFYSDMKLFIYVLLGQASLACNSAEIRSNHVKLLT